MLVVGNGNLTLEENKTHFAMWAMMASPLIASNDLRYMNDDIRNILTNEDIIAINKDPIGMQAELISSTERDQAQVWVKLLQQKGERAVALFNRSGTGSKLMTVRAEDLGLHGLIKVEDVWEKKSLGFRYGSYSQVVKPHQAVILKIRGADKVNMLEYPRLPHQVRTGYLIDQTPGSKKGIVSVNEDGKKWFKGFAHSSLRFNLGGKCQSFSSNLKVDLERTGTNGTVRFKVYGDGNLLYRSEVFNRASPSATVKLDVTKVRVLDLHQNPSDYTLNEDQIGVWENSAVTCQE